MSTTDPINYGPVHISEEDSAYLEFRALIRAAILRGPVYQRPTLFEQLAAPRAIPTRWVFANGRIHERPPQQGAEGLESALDGQLAGEPITEIRTTFPSGRPYVMRVYRE